MTTLIIIACIIIDSHISVFAESISFREYGLQKDLTAASEAVVRVRLPDGFQGVAILQQAAGSFLPVSAARINFLWKQ